MDLNYYKKIDHVVKEIKQTRKITSVPHTIKLLISVFDVVK